MAGKEVATKGKTEVAAFDMSIFEADAGVGNENITQDDLALPFLKILSGLDPLLDELEDAAGEDGPSTVAGTTVDFVHSLETVGDYVDFMCDGTTIFMRGQSKLDGGILLA